MEKRNKKLLKNSNFLLELCSNNRKGRFETLLDRETCICFNARVIQAGNYIFKVNNRNNSARSEICSKLTIKTPE